MYSAGDRRLRHLRILIALIIAVTVYVTTAPAAITYSYDRRADSAAARADLAAALSMRARSRGAKPRGDNALSSPSVVPLVAAETGAAAGGQAPTVEGLLSDVDIEGPYVRPSSPVAAQRAAVQGGTCVTCGVAEDVMRADHIDPFFEQYLRGESTFPGANEVSSVQPQCTYCSNAQGQFYGQASRALNRSLDNMFRWMASGGYGGF